MVSASPFLRFALPVAWVFLPGGIALADTPAPAAPPDRSAHIREALRASMPKYQPPPASEDATLTTSGDQAVGKDGMLKLPTVTVQAKKLPSVRDYDWLTPKGRLELAKKRYPAIKLGNLFGLNNGIAMGLVREEIRAMDIEALEDTLERTSVDPNQDNKALDSLLKGASYRPTADWQKDRLKR